MVEPSLCHGATKVGLYPSQSTEQTLTVFVDGITRNIWNGVEICAISSLSAEDSD